MMNHTVNCDGKIRVYPHITRVRSVTEISAQFFLILATVEDCVEIWQSDIAEGHLVVERYYRELYDWPHNVPTITIAHRAEPN